MSMNKDLVWAKYVKANPSFGGDGNVTLSARGLKKLFNQTWDLAFQAGLEYDPPAEVEDYEEEPREPRELKGNPAATHIFNTIFGHK